MKKTEYKIESSIENTKLNVVFYEPEQEISDQEVQIRGVIQIVHGMTEHMGRYAEFAAYFTKRGYVVAGHDIVSHGKSRSRMDAPLYMESWELTVADTEKVYDFIRERYPGEPVYLLGFSLGSFLARSVKAQGHYKKKIIAGTGWQSPGLMKVMSSFLKMKYKKCLAEESDEIRALAFDSYDKKFKGKPKSYWLVSDEKRRKEYEQDTLVNQRFSPQFFIEFMRGMGETCAHEEIENVPTLFISGSKDPVGDFQKGVEKAAKKYQSRFPENEVQIIFVPDGTHDILHDACAEKSFAKIEDFLRK